MTPFVLSHGRGIPRRAPVGSLIALALTCLAEAASVAVAVGSNSSPRWWLVFTPAFLMAVAVLVPTHAVRVATAVLLLIWIWLASASIGMFFLPAALAALFALREGA